MEQHYWSCPEGPSCKHGIYDETTRKGAKLPSPWWPKKNTHGRMEEIADSEGRFSTLHMAALSRRAGREAEAGNVGLRESEQERRFWRFRVQANWYQAVSRSISVGLTHAWSRASIFLVPLQPSHSDRVGTERHNPYSDGFF